MMTLKKKINFFYIFFIALSSCAIRSDGDDLLKNIKIVILDKKENLIKQIFIKDRLVCEEPYLPYVFKIKQSPENLIQDFSFFLKNNGLNLNSKDISWDMYYWWFGEKLKNERDLGDYPELGCLNYIFKLYELKFSSSEEKRNIINILYKIEFNSQTNVVSNFDDKWEDVRKKYILDYELGCETYNSDINLGNPIFSCYLEEMGIVAEASLDRAKRFNKIVFAEIINNKSRNCHSVNLFYEFILNIEDGVIKSAEKRQMNVPCALLGFAIEIE